MARSLFSRTCTCTYMPSSSQGLHSCFLFSSYTYASSGAQSFKKCFWSSPMSLYHRVINKLPFSERKGSSSILPPETRCPTVILIHIYLINTTLQSTGLFLLCFLKCFPYWKHRYLYKKEKTPQHTINYFGMLCCGTSKESKQGQGSRTWAKSTAHALQMLFS